MPRKKNPHVGTLVDDFFAEVGLLEECEALAIKDMLADQLREEMARIGISKTEMARRMKTSRPALDRLLDANNHSVTLHTMQRAAAAVGMRLSLHLH